MAEELPEHVRRNRAQWDWWAAEYTEPGQRHWAHLPHGELIALLRRCGLHVEELLEIRPPESSTTRYSHMTLEWARPWPCEEIWRARKPTG